MTTHFFGGAIHPSPGKFLNYLLPVHTGIWAALAWCLGILIAAYTLARTTYHHKIA